MLMESRSHSSELCETELYGNILYISHISNVRINIYIYICVCGHVRMYTCVKISVLKNLYKKKMWIIWVCAFVRSCQSVSIGFRISSYMIAINCLSGC